MTNGIALDVDPDKKDVVPHLQKYVDLIIPVSDVISDAPWKAADRKYFFDHFGEYFYTREGTPEEREQAEAQSIRATNMSLEEVEKHLGPFFRNVLVMNLSPGFRFRVSIDRLDRLPEQILCYAGQNGHFPFFKLLPSYYKDTMHHWNSALATYEHERTAE